MCMSCHPSSWWRSALTAALYVDACSNNPHPGVVESAPATNGYKGGFGTELMLKDLGLAIQAGNSVEAHLPLGANAFQLFGLSADHGGRARDFSAIYEFLSKSRQPS